MNVKKYICQNYSVLQSFNLRVYPTKRRVYIYIYIYTRTRACAKVSLEREWKIDDSPPPLSLPPSGLGRASSKEKYGTLSIFELTTISEHSCTNVFQYKQSPGRIFPGRTAARRQWFLADVTAMPSSASATPSALARGTQLVSILL